MKGIFWDKIQFAKAESSLFLDRRLLDADPGEDADALAKDQESLEAECRKKYLAKSNGFVSLFAVKPKVANVRVAAQV